MSSERIFTHQTTDKVYAEKTCLGIKLNNARNNFNIELDLKKNNKHD